MGDRLLIVDVHPVISDEDARGCSVSFGVDVLVERVESRQARFLSLISVLSRLQGREVRALHLPSILPRPLKRVGKGYRRSGSLRHKGRHERNRRQESGQRRAEA